MLSRPFYILSCLIALIAALITWGVHSTKSAPRSAAAGSRHAVKQIQANKPIFHSPQPVDWNRPVSLACLKNQLHFPLSFSPGVEYVLIVNNLDRSTRRTKTIRLSVEESTGEQSINCYFENTQEPASGSPPSRLLDASTAQRTPDTADLEDEASTEKEALEPVRHFNLFVTDGDLSDKKQYTRLKARLIQESPRVAIYLDEQQKTEELAAGLVSDLISQLENEVLDKISLECGPIRDVDGN
ncbi:MAG TPA: hypothetical protein DCM07_17435, partial [Planctomycetaceae bacterium]|nr:hypothetical protein [Planctomycetaceae bacterium]